MAGRWPWGCRGGRRRGVAAALAVLLCGAALGLLCAETLESLAVQLLMSAPGGRGRRVGIATAGPPGPPGHLREYLLLPSPSLCQRARPYLLTLVASAPAHHEARQAIRDSWAGDTEVGGQRVLTLFVVGVTPDPGLARRLAEEHRATRDLIQGRFLDTYANLTLKTLSLLGWAQRHCPQARFVAKVDDDVLFNPAALLGYLQRAGATAGERDLYLGRVHLGVAPNRDPRSKHHLPASAYAPDVYPDYCSGTAYLLSRSAARKIARAAGLALRPLGPLPPEDAFVGMCAQAAGLAPTHCPLFSGGPRVPFSPCCYRALVSAHHVSPAEMRGLWAELRASPPCSWLGLKLALGVCKARSLLGGVLPGL
ncbi:beta-1,3-galactosyltransferase 4 [Lepisosteus oculatus]|uniref:beta-1,3-galactosyltransferase 4 n=1 Tax=Lepisosteus oculatus TaxID=7918 RepID=UPI0037216791